MYIDDGYTLTATIEKTEDSPAFEVTFRPMLYGQAQRLATGRVRAHESGDAARLEEWDQRLYEAIAKSVQSWGLKDRNGKAIKVCAESVARMDVSQFGQLYNLTAGYAKPGDKGDPSPEDADAKN